MPKQTTRPQRPSSWPDYAPDLPKRKPPGRRNPWPALILVMLTLGVGSGAAAFLGLRFMQNQSATPVQSDAKAATSVKGARSTAPQPVATATGKVARDGDFAFKVNKVRTGAGQTFVYVVVRNVSTERQTLVPSLQQVRGTGERRYAADAAATSPLSKRLWNTIAPGQTRRGIMIFPAGTTAKPVAVELHGSIGSAGVLVKP